jgi:hypothetical protein
LVAEDHRRYAVGSPPGGGDDRGEQADDRGAYRRGQVGRAGIAHQQRVGVVKDAGQLGNAQLTAEVDHLAGGTRCEGCCQRTLGATSGHDDAVTAAGEQIDDLAPLVQRVGAGRRLGARVDDQIRLTGELI